MRTKCWVWTGALARGYGKIRVKVDGERKLVHVHRLAWELKHGPVPKGKCVLHRCDHPPCVRHLRLGTNKDNSIDMARKGRMSPRSGFQKGGWNPRKRSAQ